jgi:hypothetical protein
MAQVSFIDSSGVRVLSRTYQQTGERVVIWNPSRWVWSVLEIIDAKAKPEAWVTMRTDHGRCANAKPRV